jgi:hypothetical protein
MNVLRARDRPVQTSARLRISSVETVTKRQNHKLQQTKSLALTHLVMDGALGEKVDHQNRSLKERS